MQAEVAKSKDVLACEPLNKSLIKSVSHSPVHAEKGLQVIQADSHNSNNTKSSMRTVEG